MFRDVICYICLGGHLLITDPFVSKMNLKLLEHVLRLFSIKRYHIGYNDFYRKRKVKKCSLYYIYNNINILN